MSRTRITGCQGGPVASAISPMNVFSKLSTKLKRLKHKINVKSRRHIHRSRSHRCWLIRRTIWASFCHCHGTIKCRAFNGLVRCRSPKTNWLATSKNVWYRKAIRAVIHALATPTTGSSHQSLNKCSWNHASRPIRQKSIAPIRPFRQQNIVCWSRRTTINWPITATTIHPRSANRCVYFASRWPI